MSRYERASQWQLALLFLQKMSRAQRLRISWVFGSRYGPKKKKIWVPTGYVNSSLLKMTIYRYL